MDAERVWLVHKGGFASASQLRGEGHGVPEGRVKIRLDHGGEILEVDEDDVEKVGFCQGKTFTISVTPWPVVSIDWFLITMGWFGFWKIFIGNIVRT